MAVLRNDPQHKPFGKLRAGLGANRHFEILRCARNDGKTGKW
jgi:hypothetical protein